MKNHNFFAQEFDRTASKTISFFLLILVFLVLVLSISMSKNRERRVDEIRSNVVIENEVIQNPFKDLHLEAESAIVWDMNRKEAIFEKNADKKIPLASLTKLVTAAVAIENSQDLATISIDNKSLSAEGDTGLHRGEKFNIRDLLKIVLVSSSNDGARAIASAVGASLPRSVSIEDELNQSRDEDIEAFVSAMNDFSYKNGLIENNFRNEHGLDVSKIEDAGRGSAREVATLLEYLMKNHSDILEATATGKLTVYSSQGTMHQLKNTNYLVDSVPGVLASKTGFTDLAGGNVAVVTSPGIEGPFAIVVLGSSYDGRFSDLEKLSSASIKYLEIK